MAKDKDKTQVEKILGERNLVIAPVEEHTSKVYSESESGKVRIEGEVTEAKLKLAQDFHKVFTESVDEIMDLASFTPNPAVVKLIENAGLTSSQIRDIQKAPPWSVFILDSQPLMKTPDNKLESVQDYCYRLEKAVINVTRDANRRIESLRAMSQAQNLKPSLYLRIKAAFGSLFKSIITLFKN